MLCSKFFFVVLIFINWFCLIPSSLQSQDALAYPKVLKDKIDELIDNPDKFTSEERVGIYLQEVSKLLAVDTDSAYAAYGEMFDFGQEIGDSLLMGMACSSRSSIRFMNGKGTQALIQKKEAIKYVVSFPKHYRIQCRGLGDIYRSLGELDSAEYYLSLNEKLTFELKDSSEYSNVYISKALLYFKQNRYSSAIESYQNALKYIHNTHSRLREVDCYDQIGSIYRQLMDLENAKSYINKGLEVAEKQGYKSSIIKLTLNLARVLMLEGKYQEAYDALIKVMPTEIKDKKNARVCHINALLTQAALKLGNQKLAKKHHSEMQDQYSNQFTALYYVYNETNSLYHLKRNDLENVTYHAENLLSSSSPNTVISAYKILAEINKKVGNWKKSYTYQDSALVITTRSNKLAEKNIIYDYENKYQKSLKDKEISLLLRDQEIQQLHLKKQSKLLYFSLLGFLLVGLAVIGIVYAYRTKMKTNRLLKEKNSSLSESLENNKMLVKEIHHRVKNNLQVVSSLLNLQSRYEKDKTIVKAINIGKYRVQSMSLLHQNLYVNEDLKSIHIKKYFEDLANTLVAGYPLANTKLNLDLDIEELKMDIDTVVPLGLISNELITNSLKYAFTNSRMGNLHFSIKEEGDNIKLSVKDDGIGISFTEFPNKINSMGYKLIQSFAKKIKADIIIDNSKGTSISLIFKNTPNT